MSTILTANDTQFKLSDSGEVLFQPQVNNPVPGEAVARIEKGDTALSPNIVFTDTALEGDAQMAVQAWFKRHVQSVLEPLVNLKIEGQDLPTPVAGICDALHGAMGVIHREELAHFIKDLDEDGRVPLRAKKVKMGPMLVFLPELNKPAAVRLKAVLWSVFHGAILPPPTPKDGVVSIVIDPESVNRAFHQVIGYPVFGPRAIRIDMLDRVVNAVYDAAKEGKFQAQHAMAEWLGCSIDDLYAVLRAMGHKQIREAEPVAKAGDKDAVVSSEVAAKPESKPEPKEAGAEVSAEASADLPKPEAAAGEAEKKPDVKPELSWFWIKKGRASDKPVRKKAYRKPEAKKKKGARKAKETKRYEFEAKKNDEDNPFAVLGQLKS